MATRAKFKVDAIRRSLGSARTGEQDEQGRDVWGPVEKWTLEASPVYANGDPAHENSKFWEATPSGRLELGTINPAALEGFDLGSEFYVDLTPA